MQDDSNGLYKTLRLLAKTNNIEPSTIEQILNPSIPSATFEDPNFYRHILAVVENVLALSQFENFNEILRFYMSIDKGISSTTVTQKGVSKSADAFFMCIKNTVDSEIPYDNLLIVYDNLIELLAQAKDFQRLMYISNSLLSLGSRCKQSKPSDTVFLDYWRRSVSIELDLEEENVDKSSILLKAERLCIALSELGNGEEAFEIISDSIGFYVNRNDTINKVRIDLLENIWNSAAIQRLLNLASRLLADAHSHVPVAFSNLNPEVEASVLEYLCDILATSSRPNKEEMIVQLVQRIQQIIPPLEFPIRNMRVLYAFFKSTGISYENHCKGITRKLLEMITNGSFNQDLGLAYTASYIASLASLSLVVSSSVPPNEQFGYLNMAVQHMLEALDSRSNFSDSLRNDVEMLGYFLHLQGAHEKRAELLRGAIKSRYYKNQENNFSFDLHLELIGSLLALGFTGAAVSELEVVKSLDILPTLKPVDQVWLALREADCYIATSNLPNAGATFKRLCALIEADELLKMPLLAGRPASEDREHFQNRAILFAEICYTLAKLHIEEGNVEYGVSHAQKAIKFLQGFLKKFQGASSHASSLLLTSTWRMASLLITCQTLAAMAYERLGILREACYYISEASKLAKASECKLRQAAILAFESELNVRSNKVEEAGALLQECQEVIEKLNLQDLSVLHYAHSAILSLQKQRMFLEEHEYYTLSDKVFTDLKEKSTSFSIKSITEDISRLSLVEKADSRAKPIFRSSNITAPSVTVRTRTNRRALTRPAQPLRTRRLPRASDTDPPQQKPQASKVSSEEVSKSDIYGVEIVWNSIVRSQVYSLGLQNEIEGAIALLDDQYRSVGTRDNVLLNVARARNYYLLAKRELEQDPVLAFLADSAISIPSVKVTAAITNNYEISECYPTDAMKNLDTAKELLLNNVNDMMNVCTVIEIGIVSNLLNSITVLISAISSVNDQSPNGDLIPSPNFILYEISRGLTLTSDRNVVKLRSNDFNWPSHSGKELPSSEKLNLHGMLSSYKTKYIDSLPLNWAAVSISICSETGSLVLSRFEKNKAPFLLSLPLNRHNCRDANEEVFSFDHGLAQLREVIELSNATASSKRTSTIKTKEERQEWWKERYDLDQRLQELLRDAEYSWIGGFLGIFSSVRPFSAPMENFSKQFVRILRTHLPSRNWVMGGGGRRRPVSSRAGRRVTPKPSEGAASLENVEVEIHSHLLELFVGLGNPENLEDPGMLEDLVYFILDTLQFHGERNAYDEIEMDQFMVDIEELLKTYHAQVADLSEETVKANTIEHVVLILDKKSQAFPWESIPSLRQKSVSRVPSFAILENLLFQTRGGMTLNVTRDNNNCHYVLNPGRDLPRTQERFQSIFENSPGWSGLTAVAPKEAEISKMLEKGDFFVYMGHGGGQQYIRSSKIKSLEKCCPTLLLGCSSGALEEAGEYEPWGTPVSYLVAGCPMLVANMWDVTDKDIDKFSSGMLERWGAFPPSNPGMNTHMSISEAIQTSRDECNLKYLNGAAPIIYGLPLSLLYK